MTIKIYRYEFNQNNTIGKMFVNSMFFGYILEDKDRGLNDDMTIAEIKMRKLFGQTAIPSGKYEIILSYSNRFKKVLPLLLNVKGFEGIRIHGGNTEADTLGCPLLGAKRGDNKIFECAEINQKLISMLAKSLEKEKCFIEICRLKDSLNYPC